MSGRAPPRARPPPPSVGVTLNPKSKRRSIWLLSICGTITHSIHQIASWKYRKKLQKCSKEFDRKEALTGCVHTATKPTIPLIGEEGRKKKSFFLPLPHEVWEGKVTMQELHAAIASLPDKQAKRIYAHFILGMTKQDIARAEGVHEKVVRVAIERGLRRLEKILKNSL